MARKGIAISVASDTRDFSKGVASGVIAPLEDVADTLADIARAGDRSGSQLEDAMRDAQRETSDLKQEHKELHDVIQKGSRTAFRRMADESQTATREAGRHVQAFKDEARQNFAEVSSSFDGTSQGIMNGLQGLSGGLAMSMGPTGLAVAAAGAGAAAVYALWNESSEKIKQRISDMYEDMKQSGNDYLSSEIIKQAMSDIIDGADGAAASMETVRMIAETTGAPQTTVLAALAGDAKAMNELMPIVETNLRNTGKAAADYANKVGGDGARTEQLREEAGVWQFVNDKLTGVTGSIDKAREKTETYNRAVAELSRSDALSGQSRAFQEIQDQIAGVTNGLNGIPSPVVTVTLDTAAAETALTRLSAKRSVQIQAEYTTRDGRKVL